MLVLKGLVKVSAPAILILLVMQILTLGPMYHLGTVETFAGCKAITRGRLSTGHASVAYEIKEAGRVDGVVLMSPWARSNPNLF